MIWLLLAALVPWAGAAAIGASPAHLEFETAEAQRLLLFNPEGHVQKFTITDSERLFEFSEMSGTIPAGGTATIHVRPLRMRTADALIYVSLSESGSYLEPSVAIRASIRGPPGITASLIGLAGTMPAKAAIIAIASLLLAWAYLRLRKT